MKKNILLFALIFVGFGTFAQSSTIDAKSITAAQYADQAAIDAEISTPTQGMLVYNIALKSYMVYDGTVWKTQGGSSPWIENGNIISNGAGLEVFSATPNAPIPDGGQVTNIINVPLTGTIAQASDVTLFFNINHTYSGDVKVTLKSPSGTEIILFMNGFGGFGDFAPSNTISFNSLATTTIPLTSPFPTGTYLPSGAGAGDLSTLSGLAINGDWTLIVGDVDAYIDNGTFVSWGIKFDKKVGIGTSTPTAKLDIAGTIKIADGTQGLNKVLTSNANGLATWQTPAGGLSAGTQNGQMLFWNGSAWVNIVPGSEGQVLTFTASVPVWGSIDPLPTGGSTGQVLATDGAGNYSWIANGGSATYTIGLSAEQGGYIFWVSTDGKHGLVAETVDQSSSSYWYDAQNVISDPGNHSSDGANFRDWRMPTRYELNEMYLKKNIIGGFSSGNYWSSTEFWSSTSIDNLKAIDQYFLNGGQGFSSKGIKDNVRAVRAF